MKQSKMKITSLIFFNTYGPSEGRDAVIPKFIHALNHNRPIYLEGDGKQARDFTFVDDTIFALYKIIKSKIEANLTNLDLVNREEFEEIKSMIIKAREQNSILEAKIKTLEKKIKNRK